MSSASGFSIGVSGLSGVSVLIESMWHALSRWAQYLNCVLQFPASGVPKSTYPALHFGLRRLGGEKVEATRYF